MYVAHPDHPSRFGEGSEAASGRPVLFMARKKTIVYIDGFNLYPGCVRGTRYRWLGLFKFAQACLPDNEVVAVKYFTAIVNPGSNDSAKKDRQLGYLRALKTNSRISVFYGAFQSHEVTRPLADGTGRVRVIDMKEKGSDVNLATELLCDAFAGAFETAAVVSNDSDLVAPIRAVIDRVGKPVGVINPHTGSQSRPSVEMKRCCSFFRTVHKSALRDSQLPVVLEDAHGTIHRPPNW
jgi:NYN domain